MCMCHEDITIVGACPDMKVVGKVVRMSQNSLLRAGILPHKEKQANKVDKGESGLDCVEAEFKPIDP